MERTSTSTILIPMSTERLPLCRILLVEDDPDHQDLIIRKLENLPHVSSAVVTCTHANEAISKVSESEYDIILLDLSLPDSGPKETLMRFTRQFPTLPIVVLTTLAEPELVENAIEWGAQDFLDKRSLRSDVVSRSVRYAIQRKKSQNHLERQNEALRDFSQTVAHEVKSPLQSVVTALHLVKEMTPDTIDERLSKLLDLGIESTAHLTALVNELLTFAKFENDESSHIPVDLDVLVRDVIREAYAVHDMADVTINISENLPVVRASRPQLRQVLSNLISNAVKYRKGEPVSITITSRRREEVWEICVSDNGIGIDSADFKHIFKLFFRSGERSEIPGTGIGLSLSKQIIERHGGEMWVESEPGTGSSFFFTLPY